MADEHTQREIARRTGTAHTNVSAYLKGTKMPARFCVELARTLGVNLNWLLLGEGAPYLSDVKAETGETASDMLDLVQAMNSVN